MGVLDFFRRRRAPVLRAPGAQATMTAAAAGRRGWLAAQASRLTADLPGGAAAAPNRDIRQQLSVLRARSRWLAQNDGYTSGFLKLLRRNVVGPAGFGLQMRIRDDRDPKRQDENANDRIEAAWKAWGRVGTCDVTRRLSFTDLCAQVMVCVARDGEALLRRIRDPRRPYGYALQVLDPSQLREDLNGRLAGMPAGHVVRAGVEIDDFGAPAAYWINRAVPNDDPTLHGGAQTVTDRVPANEIFHLFMAEWPGQVRGIPWVAPGLRTLAMLDGYQEAELTAARVAAGKMGFYKIDGDAEVSGELEEDGTLLQRAEAGAFELMPKGVEFQSFDPQHPNAAFKDFVAASLRPAAAGLGVSYNAFANDAAGLNYSALRATELEDRDEFRTIQGWMIGAFCEPLFADWLTEALLNDALGGLPPGKFWKFNAPGFIGRGWQWVDPSNEVAAAKEAVALGIKSRTQIVAEGGGDIADIARDFAAEAALEGLPAPPTNAPAPAGVAPAQPRPQPTETPTP